MSSEWRGAEELATLVAAGLPVLTARGAVFDNVRFHADDRGVGVWVVDANRPARVLLPPACLVPHAAIDLSGPVPVIDPTACPDAPLRDYAERELRYALAPDRVNAHRALLQAFAALPESLRRALTGSALLPGLLSTPIPDDATLRQALLQARVLRAHDGTPVFMPLLDFVNHHGDAGSFDVTEAGIGVHGKAADSGELFVAYNIGDAFHLLNGYAFPGHSAFAFSMGMEFVTHGGDRVRVARRFTEFQANGPEGLRLPQIERAGGAVVCAHVWLGSARTPRKPARSFVAAWTQAGLANGAAVFAQIQRLNWLHVLDIADQTRGLSGEAADMVYAAARMQLQRMADHLL